MLISFHKCRKCDLLILTVHIKYWQCKRSVVLYNNKVNYNNKNIIKTLTKVPEIMTISESSTQIYCRQPINFASCSSPRPNLMDLMGKNFQYIKHPKNVYAKFHTYLFVEFLCHINEYFKVLFQLILLVAQYKYDRHFISHLVIKSKVHYAYLSQVAINI